MVYVEKFSLPVDSEDRIIDTIKYNNGGGYGYIDNAYPCGLFTQKQLRETRAPTTTI